MGGIENYDKMNISNKNLSEYICIYICMHTHTHMYEKEREGHARTKK